MKEPDERLVLLARLVASSPHNLVSARERGPSRLLDAHLLEAWALGQQLSCGVGERWMDLGTGAGIPGLVLACRFPDSRWVLVDSVQKKARAVEGFATALGLDNVEVIVGRAEDLARNPALRGVFDGVVVRAVAVLAVVAELARGFVKPGGCLVAMKGPSWRSEAVAAGGAFERLGWVDVHAERLDFRARETWVVSMQAGGAVPDSVPRRVGVPQRHPLS